jgi:hypothetical protein
VKPLESGRDDADDRVILLVQLDGFANCCRAAAVVALPEVVTQDGHAARFLAEGASSLPNSRPITGGTPKYSNTFAEIFPV